MHAIANKAISYALFMYICCTWSALACTFMYIGMQHGLLFTIYVAPSNTYILSCALCCNIGDEHNSK